MKLSSRPLILLGLAALAGALVVTAAIGPNANATLPVSQQKMLQNAVNDAQYGSVLANELDSVYTVSYTIGGKVANIRNIQVFAKDARAAKFGGPAAFTTQAMFPCYLSDSSLGKTITATAATAVTLNTNGGMITVVANKAWYAIVNSKGTASFTIQQNTGGTNYFLACQLETGKLAVSTVIGY